MHVLLFSGLFDVFLDDNDSPEQCEANYQKLSKLGMKIVFVTDRNLDEAKRALEHLKPEAAVITAGSEIHAPESHSLSTAFRELPQTVDGAEGVISSIIELLRQGGDMVITVGIGKAENFLRKMDLAAVMQGNEDFEPGVTVYRCHGSGPDGWNEWAEHMTRRIKIILSRKEMKHNDFSYLDEE